MYIYLPENKQYFSQFVVLTLYNLFRDHYEQYTQKDIFYVGI